MGTTKEYGLFFRLKSLDTPWIPCRACSTLEEAESHTGEVKAYYEERNIHDCETMCRKFTADEMETLML